MAPAAWLFQAPSAGWPLVVGADLGVDSSSIRRMVAMVTGPSKWEKSKRMRSAPPGSFLGHVLAQRLAQGRVQQVSHGVVKGDGG